MLDGRSQARVHRAASSPSERMRQFLADASHELRTPLTSIRGYAELARLQRGRSERRPIPTTTASAGSKPRAPGCPGWSRICSCWLAGTPTPPRARETGARRRRRADRRLAVRRRSRWPPSPSATILTELQIAPDLMVAGDPDQLLRRPAQPDRQRPPCTPSATSSDDGSPACREQPPASVILQVADQRPRPGRPTRPRTSSSGSGGRTRPVPACAGAPGWACRSSRTIVRGARWRRRCASTAAVDRRHHGHRGPDRRRRQRRPARTAGRPRSHRRTTRRRNQGGGHAGRIKVCVPSDLDPAIAVSAQT